MLPLTTGSGAEIDAVEFDLILPETISILAPALAAGVPLGDGMQKIEVREGDLPPVEQIGGSLVTIVKLEAALPAELPSQASLELENTRVRFKGFDKFRSVESVDGQIEFANSYLKLGVSPTGDDLSLIHI